MKRFASRLLFARPLLTFMAMCATLSEGLIYLSHALPPDAHYLLPWIIRAFTIGGAMLGLALIRAACRRAARHEVDNMIAEAQGLRRRQRAAAD